MVNYFNFKMFGDKFLITNDFGRYDFVSPSILHKLVNGSLDNTNPHYETLKEAFFVTDAHLEAFTRDVVSQIRSIKSYTLTGTSLHIFAVTDNCNQNCIYCQAKDIATKQVGMMSKETGEKAIEMALSSPSKYITFEFQGGEPLLNFDVVKHMILYSKDINNDKEIQYTIVSNLVYLNEDKLDFLINNKVNICTSLDGPPCVHNANRPLKNGQASYVYVRRGAKMVTERNLYLGAIQTTTKHSLKYYKELVDTYIEFGINSIFIRALTPLGFAKVNWDDIGYTPEEYLEFYKKALDYIIEVNRNGVFFPEYHARLFLRKILTGVSDNYMELRSPCGAALGQLSYYHDGSVYTCDEGRMLSESGDNAFKLGNVFENTYQEFMSSATCKSICASSVLEGLPTCCDCVYQPYCGVCPVVNYSNGKDVFSKSPGGFRCKVNMGILDFLFEKILNNNESEMNVLRSWL